MPRILSIDYGGKRTGIAVTDPLQIIATGLTAVDTKDLLDFLTKYFATEEVEKVIIGMPTHADGNDTHATPLVRGFIAAFKKQFPAMSIIPVDERYSSQQAVKALIASGTSKKDRRDKKLVDEMSAAIILREYMGIYDV
jgi:putative Holliday junction resolvase